MTSATRIRHDGRRRGAALFALVLFLLGAAGAPLLDGWLHSSESAGALDGSGHECVVCRTAATPAVPATEAPQVDASDPALLAVPAIDLPNITRAATAFATPHSRAPPA